MDVLCRGNKEISASVGEKEKERERAKTNKEMCRPFDSPPFYVKVQSLVQSDSNFPRNKRAL